MFRTPNRHKRFGGFDEKYVPPLLLCRQVSHISILSCLWLSFPPDFHHFFLFRLVEVDYKATMNSDKLKNLGWKPRKLEEALVDSVESYEKSGILNAEEEPCRVPYFYRMPPVLE